MSCVGLRVKYVGGFDDRCGSKGIIIEDYSIKFAVVKFDDGQILKARKTNLIKLNESEEINMRRLEGYYAVAATEEGVGYNKRDYYYAIFDDGNTYKTGDRVLVSGTNKDVLTIKDILTIPEAEEKCTKNITAEIICKVDCSEYNKRVEERKEKAERKKEANKIKRQMDKMVEEMDKNKMYESYAKFNPELATKLKEYKELIK